MEKDGTRECPEETTVGQTPAALDHRLYILKVNWRDDVRLVLGWNCSRSTVDSKVSSFKPLGADRMTGCVGPKEVTARAGTT
jgi:hypothetical protein